MFEKVMSIDYSRPTAAAAPTPVTRQLGLLLLRLTTGLTLLFWYGAGQALTAWSHLWQHTAWPLSNQLTALGFPLAVPISIALVLLTLMSSSFIVLGLLTRLSATTLGLTAAATALLCHTQPEIEKSALLYAGLSFTISLCGPGRFALDRLLRTTAGRRH